MAALPYCFSLQVPYASHDAALYVANAVSVDAELTPDKVKRDVRVEDSNLIACVPNRDDNDFSASDLRVLRASVNAFMDMTALCTRTLETFGDRPLLG